MKLVILASACGTPTKPSSSPAVPTTAPVLRANDLAPPESFAHIADRATRSRALFGEAAKVFTHARCVNCHPADDSPRQGDGHRLHDPPVVRGFGNHGVPAMECATCHQDKNLALARVPGAPNWSLAPASMVWLDRTPSQICAQLKDPDKNGGKTLPQIVDHLAHDPLVAWGWSPGANRTPAPGSAAQVAALVQAWADTGAECP
jgi:hypothetical protein